MIMSGKKPYFPHNWSKFKNAPDEFFFCPTYEEFDEWKLEGWELPESVYCMIRAEGQGKIQEYVYQQPAAARKRINKLMSDGVTFTVCDNNAIHTLEPNDFDLWTVS